jgi:very-short-patch-repair endonuclease
MSLPEVMLWNVLRTRPDGLKFRKQFPVGGYVADFACLARRLLIEIDGEQHAHGKSPIRDSVRDRTLQAAGFETLRIPAFEVLMQILDRCASRPLHQPPAGPPPRSGEDL